jgi:hypothetical protein
MRLRARVIWPAMVVGLGLALAACSASGATTPTPTAAGNSGGGGNTPGSGNGTPTPGSGGGGGQTANLTFQVNFTGTDTVQGSFNTTDWATFSCSDFAKSSFVWNIGIGPQEGMPTTVSGKLINFLLSAPNKMYHGTGTYMDVLPAGVTVEGDDFSGTDSTMTVNSDGSGNASFTNLPGSGSATGQTESGTVTWTCG